MKLFNNKEFNDFIDEEDKRLRRICPDSSNKDRIFTRQLKLMEEVGELSEAILSSFDFQRKDKENNKSMKIQEEFADIIIVTYLISKVLDISISDCLENKIKQLKLRK